MSQSLTLALTQPEFDKQAEDFLLDNGFPVSDEFLAYFAIGVQQSAQSEKNITQVELSDFIRRRHSSTLAYHLIKESVKRIQRLRVDPKLKKLRSLWYRKLRQKGFNDIEDESGNLKHYAAIDVTMEEFRSTESYFEAARALLHTDYVQGRDKAVWTYHCDGYSQQDIAKIMDVTQSSISKTIADIERRLIHGK